MTKKNTLSFLAFLLLVFFSVYSLYLTKPATYIESSLEGVFSAKRALQHIQKIAEKPHYVGSEYHQEVQQYILTQLQNMGFEPILQKGEAVDFFVATEPTNIMVQLIGTNPQPGNELLVLAHYDSALISSHGASDDGIGVATLLEGLRVLKSQNFVHKNNVTICFTDAEEIGLLGAKLFTQKYPSIQDIGLVLNFEARGTSGPVKAVFETNTGNSTLIEIFKKANLSNPVTNSFYYEIYKAMPNSTDATIFRTECNIPNIFFAPIDDFYYYHSVLDNANNLNINTLAHSGEYFVKLVPIFADADLRQLKKNKNRVFFNVPILKIIHYSYFWIFPLLFLAWGLFLYQIIKGLKEGLLNSKQLSKSFFSTFIVILLAAVLGTLSWKIILFLYPHYHEMTHGFPYNGHTYMTALLFLCFSFLLWANSRLFKKYGLLNLIYGGLFLCLLLCTAIAIFFKGASFLTLPIILIELYLLSSTKRKKESFVQSFICCLPAIYLMFPLMIDIPIALNMNFIAISFVLFALLMIPTLPFLKYMLDNNTILYTCLAMAIAYIGIAHLNSAFTTEKPRPNSLNYQVNLDTKEAFWKNNYDHETDEWTQPFLEKKSPPTPSEDLMITRSPMPKRIQQSMRTNAAPYCDIPGLHIQVTSHEESQGGRKYHMEITPIRKINMLIINSDHSADFSNVRINHSTTQKPGRTIKEYNGHFLTYHFSSQKNITLDFEIAGEKSPTLMFFGISYDLLNNPWVQVPPRPAAMIPKAFIITDSLITVQSITMNKE